MVGRRRTARCVQPCPAGGRACPGRGRLGAAGFPTVGVLATAGARPLTGGRDRRGLGDHTSHAERWIGSKQMGLWSLENERSDNPYWDQRGPTL